MEKKWQKNLYCYWSFKRYGAWDRTRFAKKNIGSCNCSRQRTLEALADEVSQASGNGSVIPYVLDQNDDQATQTFVKEVTGKENQIDLLVNSAYAGLIAIAPHCGKPFWERPISVFDASIKTGLRSSYVMSSLLAPVMVKQKSGLMVQVSSFGGVQYLFDIGYGVGKAGLDRLTTDMAAELKPHGVQAITLYPGAAVTEVTAFQVVKLLSFGKSCCSPP